MHNFVKELDETEGGIFIPNQKTYSNSKTIIKPFKDEALIVPNFRQMLFLVSYSMGRRKVEAVASQCLLLNFSPARNTQCLETEIGISARLNCCLKKMPPPCLKRTQANTMDYRNNIYIGRTRYECWSLPEEET